MMKYLAVVAIIPIFLSSLLLVPNVYAGGPRLDYPDVYSDAGEEGDRAQECWVDGEVENEVEGEGSPNLTCN